MKTGAPIAIAAILAALSCAGQPPTRIRTLPPLMHKGEPVKQLLARDAIPSIDEPVFVKASEADFMSDQEPVLGIDVSDPPRAYSTFQLERHEIVNDEIGGRAIAATW